MNQHPKTTCGVRSAISKRLRIQVHRRDGWMCRWCGRPVIFGPAMRQLEKLARQSGANTTALAYYHAHWTRKDAPLLDHLGASVDHVEAHSRGGEHGLANFVTACNKCNTRKNDADAAVFSKRVPLHQVKGKYGEPQGWDGFSSVFVALVERHPEIATTSDLSWLRALKQASDSATGERGQ